MGYALFAQRKLLLTGQLNSVQLQQTQRGNEQFQLATQHSSLQQQISSLGASESSELAVLYGQLSSAQDTNDRNSINAIINQKQEEFKHEQDTINRRIYQVSIKENALEMEVKRLDTMVTKIQKDLEAIEQAEATGIENATPKFNGIG